MKFTLSWLKDHLDTDADAATVADTLTRIGLEVESVDNPAEALAPFKVAKVLTAEKHPQADKLQVLTVDAGDGQRCRSCAARPTPAPGCSACSAARAPTSPAATCPEGGGDPRGREQRHDVLGARAAAGRGA